MERTLARASVGGRTREDGSVVAIQETSVADAGAACIGVAIVGLGGRRYIHHQGSRRHRERSRIAGGLSEEVIRADGREAGPREAIGAHVTGQRGVGREGQCAGDGSRQGVAITQARDRARKGRFRGPVSTRRGLRDDG